MADLVPVLTPAPPTATTPAVTVHVITTSIRVPVAVPTTWADFDGQGGRTGMLEGR